MFLLPESSLWKDRNGEASWRHPTFSKGEEKPNKSQQQQSPSPAPPPALGILPSCDFFFCFGLVSSCIDRLGMGRFQFWILLAAGICFAAGAVQIQMLFVLGPILQQTWQLSKDQTAGMESMVFVGQMTGAFLLGPLAQVAGRRPMFLVLAASCITLFGATMGLVVTDYIMVLPVVFMIGMGVGGLTVPFDILSEFLPLKWRGKILLILGYFWTIGVLFVVGVASKTLLGGRQRRNLQTKNEGDGDYDEWRRFAMLCSLPCPLSVLLGWWLVPESPRWLCTQGRCQEALDILRHASHINHHGRDDQSFPGGIQLKAKLGEFRSNTTCCDLVLAPQWKWTMIRLWSLWGTMSFGYYVTVMATTKIFAELEPDATQSTTTENTTTKPFDYGALWISTSAKFLGSTVAIGLVDSVGRIPIQVICFAMAGICVSVLCLLALYDHDDTDGSSEIGLSHSHRRNVLLFFGFTARVFEMAASCVTWVSTAEILTTDIRTTGTFLGPTPWFVIRWKLLNDLLANPLLLRHSPLCFSLSGISPGHSTANAIARIGGMLGPFLVEDARILTIGVVIFIVRGISVFCVSGLPETKGSHHMGMVTKQQRLTGAMNDDSNVNFATTICCTTELVGVLEAAGDKSLLNGTRH
jgi:MFS family permease